MAFLSSFKKELGEMDGVGTSSAPPRYWTTTGNYVLNKIISGMFDRGIPQGRITNLAGPSGAGKSFLAANLVREAQKMGQAVLVVDSEQALDDEFMTKIGVDVKKDYVYADVMTIQRASAVVSRFIQGYKKDVGDDKDAQPIFILIDSLDMLLTETELENYDKGVQKGDQGQRNKQLKQMLRTFVQDIKHLNATLVVTSQVYKNQDLLNGEGLWIVSDAVKFSASQIVLLTKTKLKTKDAKGKSSVLGIHMKCEGYKTRFTKPFQTVTIEVPYAEGMDPYSGLVNTCVGLGIVEKAGSRYQIIGEDTTWYEKDVSTVAEKLLKMGDAKQDAYLQALTEMQEDISDQGEDKDTTASKRKAKAAAKKS